MATTSITVTITTPAGLTVAQLLQTLCNAWNWDPAGGQTQAQFVQAQVARLLRETYVGAAAGQAAQAAQLSAAASALQVTVV